MREIRLSRRELPMIITGGRMNGWRRRPFFSCNLLLADASVARATRPTVALGLGTVAAEFAVEVDVAAVAEKHKRRIEKICQTHETRTLELWRRLARHRYKARDSKFEKRNS